MDIGAVSNVHSCAQSSAISGNHGHQDHVAGIDLNGHSGRLVAHENLLTIHGHDHAAGTHAVAQSSHAQIAPGILAGLNVSNISQQFGNSEGHVAAGGSVVVPLIVVLVLGLVAFLDFDIVVALSQHTPLVVDNLVLAALADSQCEVEGDGSSRPVISHKAEGIGLTGQQFHLPGGAIFRTGVGHPVEIGIPVFILEGKLHGAVFSGGKAIVVSFGVAVVIDRGYGHVVLARYQFLRIVLRTQGIVSIHSQGVDRIGGIDHLNNLGASGDRDQAVFVGSQLHAISDHIEILTADCRNTAPEIDNGEQCAAGSGNLNGTGQFLAVDLAHGGFDEFNGNGDLATGDGIIHIPGIDNDVDHILIRSHHKLAGDEIILLTFADRNREIGAVGQFVGSDFHSGIIGIRIHHIVEHAIIGVHSDDDVTVAGSGIGEVVVAGIFIQNHFGAIGDLMGVLLSTGGINAAKLNSCRSIAGIDDMNGSSLFIGQAEGGNAILGLVNGAALGHKPTGLLVVNAGTTNNNIEVLTGDGQQTTIQRGSDLITNGGTRQDLLRDLRQFIGGSMQIIKLFDLAGCKAQAELQLAGRIILVEDLQNNFVALINF